MKACAAWMLALLMLLPVCGASAQMRLYVQEGALDVQEAERIRGLLEGAFAQEEWQLEMGGELGELVLSDRAPDLAVCTPGDAWLWAREGLLLALHARIGNQARIQRQVLESCVEDESLFMLPLLARHRQMAVNRQLLEEKGLGYFLDRQTYPVWMPAQFYQILEEFMIRDDVALDIWRADVQTGAPIEALAQAIFGGTLLTQEGECAADTPNMRAGVRYLADAVQAEMIGWCEGREAALERFIAGETAMFIDWTPQEAARQQPALEAAGLEIVCMPYPSATGMPVRSYELTGICAFASGDAARDALALDAAALVHEQAQNVLGARGIWRDGAVWLWDLGAHEQGATLRSLFAGAYNDVMESGVLEGDALADVQAAMDAMR